MVNPGRIFGSISVEPVIGGMIINGSFLDASQGNELIRRIRVISKGGIESGSTRVGGLKITFTQSEIRLNGWRMYRGTDALKLVTLIEHYLYPIFDDADIEGTYEYNILHPQFPAITVKAQPVVVEEYVVREVRTNRNGKFVPIHEIDAVARYK
jgi:hypothetical protein